jgi:transposase
LFEIERSINGKMPAERVAVRQERAKPLVDDLKVWMRQQRDRLAPSHDLAKAINYILSRWVAFTRFLDDGRICLSNNVAERAVRCVAVGRKNWTFAGSDAGGHRAAAACTLIETCKLNDVDPQAWLAECSHDCPIIPLAASPNCCRGTGRPRASTSQPDHSRSHDPVRLRCRSDGLRAFRAWAGSE